MDTNWGSHREHPQEGSSTGGAMSSMFSVYPHSLLLETQLWGQAGHFTP